MTKININRTKNKDIVVYDVCDNDHKKILTFNFVKGESKIISKQELYNSKINYLSSDHIFIKRPKKIKISIPLSEVYANIKKNADILLKESKGVINIYQSGCISTTALDLFRRLQAQPDTENITKSESQWLNKATLGAMIWDCDKEHKIDDKDLYKFDFVSMYPSIMQSAHFSIPLKKGEFSIINTVPKYFGYGIYRCEILYNTPCGWKLFKQNKDNYYTHIDLNRAIQLGLKIKLILDGKYNSLFYSRDSCIAGNKLFKTYVDFCFDMKKKGCKPVKEILNCLWGILCKTSSKSKYFKGDINLKNHEEIQSLNMYDDSVHVTLKNKNKPFCDNLGRMKPFLLAKGRWMISKEMEKNIDSVVRMHTDGFSCTSKEPWIKCCGNELGKLQKE